MIPRQSASGPRIALPGAPGNYDNGVSGSAKQIDWSRGPAQKITVNANCTLDLFAGLVEGESCRLMLTVQQDATGNRIVVIPFLKTANNADLVFSTTAGRYDLVELFWDGHNLAGAFFAKNLSPS